MNPHTKTILTLLGVAGLGVLICFFPAVLVVLLCLFLLVYVYGLIYEAYGGEI